MHASDVSRGRQILSRFLALADERLAYLTELYESGRWERYFTQAELLDNVREAKKAVASWTLLVSTEALPNNRPIDLSWLDSSRPLPPRRPLSFDVERPDPPPRFADERSVPKAIASELLPQTLGPIQIDAPIAMASPARHPTATSPIPPPWQHSLDHASLEKRYPLLRRAG